MTGTAYRTSLPPSPSDPSYAEAVYAVWPPARYTGGETTHLMVVTCPALHDTCIYPADRTGQMIGFELIMCAVTTVHRVALQLAGYDLELAIPRTAVLEVTDGR